MSTVQKVVGFYRSRGLNAVARQIIKSLGSRLGIAVTFVERKKVRDGNKARKIFSGRGIKYDPRGLWHVNPMPSSEQLAEYYQYSYWDSFNPRDFGVGLRDFRHYHLLTALRPDFHEQPRSVLNLGAGHGGLSCILRLKGHNITNVEPSEMINLFSEGWVKFSSLADVNTERFDLIYGSHSLEHVQDIDSTLEHLKRLSDPATLHFWEVPNAKHPHCGVNENRIDIPHTYYFTEKFFSNTFSETVYCRKYSSQAEMLNAPHAEVTECDGDALLFVGRL